MHITATLLARLLQRGQPTGLRRGGEARVLRTPRVLEQLLHAANIWTDVRVFTPTQNPENEAETPCSNV